MVATIRTIVFEGVQVVDIEVQVQLAPGLPAFTIVGLPDKAVNESRDRVRSAIHAMGLSLPARKIIINLAPADILKEGSHFDLPIALALLVAMGVVPQDAVENAIAMGELSLDGRVLPVAGVLPAAIHANANGAALICPEACGSEAAWSGIASLLATPSVLALLNHIQGKQLLPEPKMVVEESFTLRVDMREIRGQATARRALEIAAAGAHNMLMCGPPGAGKSMLASCLPGILPPMSSDEILEYSMIASIAGKLTGSALSRTRPFRDPHHSSSMAAMVGGGRRALPGEISLAHQGVLFLDELPEFQSNVLESLRQPMETGNITVARAAAHVTYPARFQLIAAMNPCRCGYLSDAARACGKSPKCAVDYQARISGPLLDRMDIAIDVPEVPTLEMLNTPEGEPSEVVRGRVTEARKRQRKRFDQLSLRIRTNAELYGDALTEVATPDQKGLQLLEQATQTFRLSMRGYSRVLKVARTIADIEGSEGVSHIHIGEALAYRQLQYRRMAEVA